MLTPSSPPSRARLEWGELTSECWDWELRLLPATPSHQFNPEYAGTLSATAVPATAEEQGLTPAQPAATLRSRQHVPLPSMSKKYFAMGFAGSSCWTWLCHLSSTPQPWNILQAVGAAHLVIPALGCCCCLLAAVILGRAIWVCVWELSWSGFFRVFKKITTQNQTFPTKTEKTKQATFHEKRLFY